MSRIRAFAGSMWREVPGPIKGVVRSVRGGDASRRIFGDWLAFRRESAFIVESLRQRQRDGFEGDVLIHCVHGFVPAFKEEFLFGAMLLARGFRPVYLLTHDFVRERYLRMLPGARFVFWDDYYRPPGPAELASAASLVGKASTLEDLITLEIDGIATGRHALSLVMRAERIGTLDLQRHGAAIASRIADSIAAARAARACLERTPCLAVLMNERGYTPYGEFFDAALLQHRRVIQYVNSHRDDARVFKAYTVSSRTQHPYSLSEQTWKDALAAPFGPAQVDELMRYWEELYASRSWFNFQRIQHLTRMVDADRIRTELALDPAKKTAVVFSHIFWDATFFYGDSVYADYQQWFVETVRLANRNANLNWIIKLHPVNVWRLEADGVPGARYSELDALDAAGVVLAPHVKLLLPDTAISTWSLFHLADGCVTVRGTVGIEMSALGKRVVTAGSGHYAGKGFTSDATTVPEYEQLIGRMQDLPPLSADQQLTAQRFAYWLLKRKPFAFETYGYEYESGKDVYHPLNGRPHFTVADGKAFLDSPRARFWADWMARSPDADCLATPGDDGPASTSTSARVERSG